MTARLLYNWWSRLLVDIRQSTISNAPLLSRDSLKFDAELTMLDGLGNDVHIYRLLGCWPERISPDDLDFEESSIAEIELTLRFDKCEEIPIPHYRITIS